MSRIYVAERPGLVLPGAQKIVLPALAYAHGGRMVDAKLEPVDLRSLGFLPGIAGGDRGINTEGDVLTTTADGRDLNVIWTEFQRLLGLWNEQRQSLIDFLTFSVDEEVEMVPQVPTVDFEEASEFGEPKRIRGVGFSPFAYDLKFYDIGISFTWKFLLKARANQIEALQNQVLEADNRLLFSKTLKAIFNNVTRTTDENGTIYNVFPFYNADATVPPAWKTTVHATAHQHYFTSGAAAPSGYDSVDIDLLETHLGHHGYGAVTGSRLVLMFNSVNTAPIRGAKTPTWKYDFVPSSTQPAFFTTAGGLAGGAQPQGQVAGLNVIGSYGNFLVIEDDWLPANYVLAFATGGFDSADNPVGLREDPRAAGLRLVKGREPDYPLIDSFYQRGFGTGIRKRGAGAVMFIDAGGSYVIPVAYA
jgi:hypothetical protein